eukprot:768716-Hanusia_phi.AAC.7
MQAGDQIQGMQEDKRRNLRVAATVAIGVGLVVALVTLAHVLQGDSMVQQLEHSPRPSYSAHSLPCSLFSAFPPFTPRRGPLLIFLILVVLLLIASYLSRLGCPVADRLGASEMISSLVKVASSSAAASPLSHGTSVATGSDKLLKLSRDPRYKAFNERVKKESSSELLKDSQTAEEQLNSEKSYDKMIATQKRGIEGRDAHFQHSSEYENSYQNAVQSVQTRDKVAIAVGMLKLTGW